MKTKELLEELNAAFDAADEMVGCGDPDEFDSRRARIAEVRKETLRRLNHYTRLLAERNRTLP